MLVVPYVPGWLRNETAAWAEANGARMVDVGSDNEAYWRLLAAEWARAGATLIVEHDMLPAEGVAGEMMTCPESWCVSPYRIGHPIQTVHGREWPTIAAASLGCTKFGTEVKLTSPGLMDAVAATDHYLYPGRHWARLDVSIAALLRRAGWAPHEHRESRHLRTQ